ncbi:hypothetical protein HMN09_00926800 [Mycena chlorophos]|uniref:DUF6534 domain-containing protein n=1 Tax=Mycena chlorophos TaxID=658473 RepID=A0A8H6SKP1_MYCCL|nr:hypothetical protein HMN09_00926800 [Mycena chlorophos]
MASVDVGWTIGAFEIGTLISYIMFGVTTAQAYTYYTEESFDDDPWWMRVLIAFVWLVELTHVVCIGQVLYLFTVSYYDQPIRLVGAIPVGLALSIVLSGVITGVVQSFFAYRIFSLSLSTVATASTSFRPESSLRALGVRNSESAGSAAAPPGRASLHPKSLRRRWLRRWHFRPIYLMRLVPPAIWLAEAVYVVFSLVATVISFPSHSPNIAFYLARYGWILRTAWIMNLIMDSTISASLVFVLLQNREKGMGRTTALVDQIVRWTIETGVLTSLFSVLNLVVYDHEKPTFIWVSVQIIKTRLFSNSLLASLNSRKKLRAMDTAAVKTERIHGLTTGGTNTNMHITVGTIDFSHSHSPTSSRHASFEGDVGRGMRVRDLERELRRGSVRSMGTQTEYDDAYAGEAGVLRRRKGSVVGVGVGVGVGTEEVPMSGVSGDWEEKGSEELEKDGHGGPT